MGPTAIGKTAYAIRLAKESGTEILSCDSRQFYQELNIGVARPSEEELKAAKHHFIACRSVENPFNVYSFEQEALQCLEKLFERHDIVVAVGGSGLYIDALCKGIALLPDPKPGLREQLKQQLQAEGIESFQKSLQQLDPAYYAIVDKQNPVRLQRALEVCITSGKPYSELIAQQRPIRNFEIKKTVLTASPEELRERINRRVDLMIEMGLEEEVRQVMKFRHLNTLNTVGYKEFFEAWDQGNHNTQSIAEAIKTHTWQYAKKQLTWIKRDSGATTN
ncbi:MAG: tRNA (adenosine(37)-N6)-dimethylallyltransferase MiaA [Bacteroidales bacterium]|nr:tRNA (adenosine(37)-N6)-dimethylallyltransferase MiaA [Candidatus Colimorpha pelethequi]